MKRDSIFYKLFQQSPSLLFQLLKTPPSNAEAYSFDCVVIKEPKFEIDGVFLPPETGKPGTVFFCVRVACRQAQCSFRKKKCCMKDYLPKPIFIFTATVTNLMTGKLADSVNSRVQVFDKNGNFLTAYGQPAVNASGEIVPPPALDAPPYGNPLDLEPGKFNWTGGTSLKDGKLYVGDFFQGRVQVLDINNTNSTRIPEASSVLGLAVLGAFATVGKLKMFKA